MRSMHNCPIAVRYARAHYEPARDEPRRRHEAQREPVVRLLNTIPVPVRSTNMTAGLYSFDISWVDQATGTYYLADRSNQAVDTVEAETFVTQIAPTAPFAPFAGFTPCS